MNKLLFLPFFCLLFFIAGCINFNSSAIKLADTDAEEFVLYRDAVYFSSFYDIWKTDGTEKGTIQISNINSQISLHELTVVDDLLYFSADDGINGVCLWVTDGSTEGTRMVKDSSGVVLSNPTELTVLNNKLFFVYDHPELGSELWTSGGTAETTHLIKNIQAESEDEKSGYPEKLTVCGNLIFFSANDGNGDYGLNRQLWQTDGTPEGTKITDEVNQPEDSSPYCMSCAGEQFYFFADSYLDHSGLLTVNTIKDSTLFVKEFPNNTVSEFGNATAALQGKLYMQLTAGDGFSIESEDEGVFIATEPSELWTSDGTETGTQLIARIDTAYGSDHINNLNGKLYFTGGWKYGSRLWQSDGTKEGTVPLSILLPGEHQYPFGMLEHKSQVYYFIKNKKTEYVSLAVTDGKTNTLLHKDFLKGEMQTDDYVILNNMIIFENSRQLYALPLSKGGE